jgi:Protein of unknown function (DUF732)
MSIKSVTMIVSAAAVVLAGCGGSPPPAPVTVTETTAIAAPTTTVGHGGINDQDRVFLATIGKDDYFSNVPRDSLFESAHVLCDRANLGPEQKAEAIQSLIDKGMPLEHATNFSYAAILGYCPNQLTGVQ